MPKQTTDYESYLSVWDGAVWLLKENALRLGAGYLPVHDDKTMAPKLLAPNEQAELNLLTLLGAFNDDRLTIERPRAYYAEGAGTFDGDGFTYVEAVGFLNWLGQYITQTQAKEIAITFPSELARAVKKAKARAQAAHPSANSETFDSLTIALDGQFDKPLEELPEALRQRVVREFFKVRWNKLAPEQRRCHAQTLDNRNNPDKKPEQQRLFQFYAELYGKLQVARDKLAKWESVATPEASDLEKQEAHVEKWRREIARLELLENSAQATTCDDTARLGDGMESAGADVGHELPPGANDMVVGPAKLCRAFGLGENSFSAVTRRVKAYNDRYPDTPIQFGRIGQSPSLRSREIWKILATVGGCSGKRTKKETSKKT